MEDFDALAKLINHDLDTGEEQMLVPVSGIDYSELHSKLSVIIAYMLDHHFEKLCNIMYRLDVSEKKFQKVLTGRPAPEIAPAIAELVIEREMQKIRTRILYKNGKL